MKYKLLSSLYYSDKNLYQKKYEDRFNSESTYKFNFNIKNNQAFVVINREILSQIDRILTLDKELYSCTEYMPNIALRNYKKRCLIDEIKTTNDIEGVHSTRKEINDILNDKSNRNKRLYGIVTQYQKLLEEEDINLKTCQDIRRLYDEITLLDIVNENKDHAPDGEIFRKEIVYIFDKKQEIIHRGITPEAEIINVMSSCLNDLYNSDINFLIRIAVFHYAFGYIHPFYDGNGRTSRFISSYLLSKKLEELVSFRLAYTIRQNISKYQKSFNIVNDEKNKGDMTSFIITFFEFLIESLEDLNSSLEEGIERLSFYDHIIKKIFRDSKIESIVFILVQNALFGEGGLDINVISSTSEMGSSKAREILKVLEERGLISKDREGRKFVYTLNINALLDIYEKQEM